MALVDIRHDIALIYKAWWAAKVAPKNAKTSPVTANTANRHIGNIRSLYTDYFKHIGEESRPNLFCNIHFKAKVKKEVPAFENDWVRSELFLLGDAWFESRALTHHIYPDRDRVPPKRNHQSARRCHQA